MEELGSLGEYYDRIKKVEKSEFVHRGANPLELEDYDDQGNFYIKPRRRTALTVMTPDGKLTHAEHLPNTGFSFTTGLTEGEFGSLSLKIPTSEIKNKGGKFYPSIDGPDYFYAEVPENQIIKCKLAKGKEKFAKLGALSNLLAGNSKDGKFVITPFADTPVESGFRLSSGEHKIKYRREENKIVVDELPKFFEENPKLYHSLMINILMRIGYRFEHFDVDKIILPGGETHFTQWYTEDLVIKQLKKNPNNLKVYYGDGNKT